jgi:hypothetical protein
MTVHVSSDRTSTSGQLVPWEEYPSRETARTSCLDGVGYFRDRLERDSERLFSDKVNVDVMCRHAGERVELGNTLAVSPPFADVMAWHVGYSLMGT